MTALLNVYLGCKLLYLYKAIQYGKNNPGVVFIENLAYNMKVNTFTAMRFIYRIADDFMWKHTVEDYLEPEVDESSDNEYNPETGIWLESQFIQKMNDPENIKRYGESFIGGDSTLFRPKEEDAVSSEEEDNDSSSDYEEWVYKRPCIQESHKAEDSVEDADDEATENEVTEDDDLSPLFTCKICQITTKTKDYVFVVFCKDEYCFNCFTNVFYKTPMNEIKSYYLDETLNNRDDGWYNPETGTFYTGFWLESQFIPKMNDPENIKRYGESFIGGDSTLFRPKEEDDESSGEEQDAESSGEEQDAESSGEEQDDESSEEEDNDSSSDYEERVFKKVDSAKDATKYTCSICEISTKNPYVEFVVFCGKEYCGICYTKALYTTPLKKVDAYYSSERPQSDGWYDPESKTFHIGFWGNYEFTPIMDDVRNIRRYGYLQMDDQVSDYVPKELFPEDLPDAQGLSEDAQGLPAETSSDDFADNDFTEHDFSEIL